ncbi:hypothetical protein [Paenibacillus sp. N3.4]|uniref:hypothetical protein n=1 Tax=Paenibacillus sp. N3.4 TaxID=2603222 RepID=UPI0011CB5C6F|nr:hypothetical protein [Paenibacillus sp. N3.4]TXK85023.1 hypothetical protein FU659_05845 [Paenibacillus sp. N3.4]
MKKKTYKSKKRRPANMEIAQATAQISQVMNRVPVLIALTDGSYYYGMIRGVQGQELLLEGVKGKKKLPRNLNKEKASISGLGGLVKMFGGGGLGSLLGGFGGGGSGSSGASKGGGFFGKIGGFMKIGMGVLKFIMPLMGGFGF